MNIYIICVIGLGLIFLCVLFFGFVKMINTDDKKQTPYDPEPIKKQIQVVDNQIKDIDKQIEQVKNENFKSADAVASRFRTINRH